MLTVHKQTAPLAEWSNAIDSRSIARMGAQVRTLLGTSINDSLQQYYQTLLTLTQNNRGSIPGVRNDRSVLDKLSDHDKQTLFTAMV